MNRAEPNLKRITYEAGKNASAREQNDQVMVSAPVLADLLGITDKQIRVLVAEGMPKARRAEYPLKACVQWYLNFWRDRAQGRVGNEARNRKSEMEAKLLEVKVAKASGNFIDRAEVLMVWGSTFARIGKMLDSLPAALAREFGWSHETVKAVRARLDDARRNFVRDSAEYLDVVEEMDGDDAAKQTARD